MEEKFRTAFNLLQELSEIGSDYVRVKKEVVLRDIEDSVFIRTNKNYGFLCSELNQTPYEQEIMGRINGNDDVVLFSSMSYLSCYGDTQYRTDYIMISKSHFDIFHFTLKIRD